MSEPCAESDRRLKLVLVTGLSGSGKSTAANAFEDLGYYCVDNLPLPLLATFLEDPEAQVAGQRQRIALVADVRAPGFAEQMTDVLRGVDREKYDFEVLFLEASQASLVRRFSETRRPHPLACGERPLIEGIRREQELMADIRGVADRIFDSSDWSVHDVRREIYREYGDEMTTGGRLVVSLVSFGFKHGAPAAIDLMFDVRFLPNPYFRPGLREQSGLDQGVRDFLDEQPDFHSLTERLEDLLLFLLPRYQQENRSYVSVAIGCTGGRHRSVAVSEQIGARLRAEGWTARVNHRDLQRASITALSNAS